MLMNNKEPTLQGWSENEVLSQLGNSEEEESEGRLK